MSRWIADTVPDSTHRIYSRANAGEIMPNPVSPLVSSFFWAGQIAEGWRQAFVDLGVADLEEFERDRPNHFGVFAGYMYLNISWARIFGVRGPGMTPEMIDQQYYGDMPGIPAYATEARPEDDSAVHTERFGACLVSLLSGEDLPGPREDKARLDQITATRPDLAALSSGELVARARQLNAETPDLFRRHLTTSLGCGIGWVTVGGVCAAVGRSELTMSMVGATGDLDSAGPAEALWELGRLVRGSARLTEAFDAGADGLMERLARLQGAEAESLRRGLAEVIARFGSRGPNELELYAESCESSPHLVLSAIDRLRLADDAQNPAASAVAANGRAAEARAEVDALISADPLAAGTLAAGIRCATLYDAGRERTKTNLVTLVHELRLVFQELGNRAVRDGALAHPDHVFMLHADELDAFVAAPLQFKAVIAEREEIYRSLFDLQPPFVFFDGVPTIESLAPRQRTLDPAHAGAVLNGISGSAGTATGRARIITDPGDPRGLEPGEILVATITSPAWTPLFMTAAAVVVEVGAAVSHAVIVSRELGIPCVVSLADATSRIPDGALLAVDGSRGTVTILES
jgi:pyruvate,water dikinase